MHTSSKSRQVMCVDDNVEAEVDGIILAFQMALEHFSMFPPISESVVTIITDCEAALMIVRQQAEVSRWLKYFQTLWYVDDRLKALGVMVRIAWIPSHCGIPMNERADEEAKRVSRSKLTSKIFTSLSLE